MRLLILFFVLTLIVASGCNTEGDNVYNSYNYYYPEDSTGNPDTTETYTIQIPYPGRNEVVEMWHNWIEYPNPNYQVCRWGYKVDTAFFAEVTTDIPGTIVEARLFLRTSPNGSFNQYTVVQYPGGSPFQIRIFERDISFSSSIEDDRDYAFWVSLTTEDSTNYISPTIPFRVISRVNFDMDSAPMSPTSDTLYETTSQQSLRVEWCPLSPNAEGFSIALRPNDGGQIRYFPASNTQQYLYINDYLPISSYSVWVLAYNDNGVSSASDTMYITTNEPILPNNLNARVYSDERVEIYWSNRCFPDSLLVSRRDTLSEWSTIKSLGCYETSCQNSYSDTTAASNTVYYYRVGTKFSNGVWWAPDSIGVWIP